MITQTTVRPSVWIGCLACYNEGILNGRWFPAEEAGEVTPEDLHLGLTAHDELWIFGLRVKNCVRNRGFSRIDL